MDSGGGSKCIISRDVTFDETRMGMKCKDSDIVVPEKVVEETQFEVELPEERMLMWMTKFLHQILVKLNQWWILIICYQEFGKGRPLWHLEGMALLFWFFFVFFGGW